MKEIWREIPNFSGYQASSFGRLRSKNYKRTGKVKVLKPALSSGYLKTMILSDEGKYKSWNVHKFVTLAFYGAVPDGLEVNHIDGVKTNNHIDNLEYCTHAENVQHSFDMNLQQPKRGSSNGMAKLTEQDVIEIREYVKENRPNYGRRKLAQKYGISDSHIKDVISGRRGIWSHI